MFWSDCCDLCMFVLQLPLVFVAVLNNQAVGTIGLDTSDFAKGPYAGAGPWLVCVYVDAKFRKRGIAAKLIEHALSFARDTLKLEHLWLWTERK